MKKIKSVTTDKFELVLYNNRLEYHIEYKFADEPQFSRSEDVKDLNIANFLFEQKRIEMEGN